MEVTGYSTRWCDRIYDGFQAGNMSDAEWEDSIHSCFSSMRHWTGMRKILKDIGFTNGNGRSYRQTSLIMRLYQTNSERVEGTVSRKMERIV